MINLHVQFALSLRRILLTHIELARLITCEVVIVESVLCKVWMTIDLTISSNEQKHLIAIGTARHLRLVAKLVEQELLHHNCSVLISAECLRGFTNEEEYRGVWNKRDEWPNFESIEAYCLTVARNLAIDRSEKIDSQHMELTPETQELPDALNPYEQLAQSEQLGLIHRLLNELPEKQRSIMQLRDIEGKSYKEIADILQITEEQVKINLFRSRQKIKQRYTEIEDYGL